MSIIVICRTRNEELNIRTFCEAYHWADRILVADGESVDRTVEIARAFSNVLVRTFDQKVLAPDGETWHNPDGSHLNFLIDWAHEFADLEWMIADDCDSFPTRALQNDALKILAEWQWDVVCVRRFYLWYNGRYFPKLDVGASPWAWRPKKWNVRATNNDFHPTVLPLPNPEQQYAWQLPDPYRLLHYSWRSEEQVQAKIKMYAAFGVPMTHPLESCGELVELPEWAMV
jgi:hypothetical protein